MSKKLRDELCLSFYNSYQNIMKKHGLEPMPYRLFRMRVNIWREW